MNKTNIIIYLILLTIILALGFSLYNTSAKKSKNLTQISTEAECPYAYLNPLRCETDPVKKKEYVTLRNDLLEVIETESAAGKVSTVAIHFRDLQNGPLMSINANEDFAPASLLKVPLLMTYLKKAEADPSLLKKTLTVVSDIKIVDQNIKPKVKIEKGKTYTIEEVLKILITQSENTAQELLLKYLNQEYSQEDFIDTLSDLGIIDPRKGDIEQYIAVHSYAAIFRILYNSSYLNFEMSNKALEFLSQTEFKEGLVAGIPSGIPVAHKFGEIKRGDEQQLHDCGIVYYPESPYALCIMTKGKNIADQEEVIEQISKKVYDEVVKRD